MKFLVQSPIGLVGWGRSHADCLHRGTTGWGSLNPNQMNQEWGRHGFLTKTKAYYQKLKEWVSIHVSVYCDRNLRHTLPLPSDIILLSTSTSQFSHGMYQIHFHFVLSKLHSVLWKIFQPFSDLPGFLAIDAPVRLTSFQHLQNSSPCQQGHNTWLSSVLDPLRAGLWQSPIVPIWMKN